MDQPQHIRIKDYNYLLPDERIAKFPLKERDQSKMLVWQGGKMKDEAFFRISNYLPKGELLVMNNTRVIRARLRFRKDTALSPTLLKSDGAQTLGAQIEIFLLEPAIPQEYQENFLTRGSCTWYCLVGNLKKWKRGELRTTIQASGQNVTVCASRQGVHGTSQVIRFDWNGNVTWAEVLEAMGELPIPPYLNRKTEQSDLTTYQTVYSKIKGSVAAPTAGLHFTERVLAELDEHGVEREEVTLHVGAGTFKPVKSEEIGDHDMHSEHIVVTRQTIEHLIAHGGHCTAVGTTSVRTLESLYYIGKMLMDGMIGDEDEIVVPQWLPYEDEGTTPPPPLPALQAILNYLDRHELPALQASTKIIIAPGYRYHIVHRMLTNFHQPQSTLLLLVSAFIGEEWHELYAHALASGYRFLSYGDCCLLES